MEYVVYITFLLALFGTIVALAIKYGRSDENAETSKEVLRNTSRANRARDRLRSNPSYAERMRDKYTIK